MAADGLVSPHSLREGLLGAFLWSASKRGQEAVGERELEGELGEGEPGKDPE